MSTETKAPAVILKGFFGLKDGQTLTDFAKELKGLTEEDRTQLVGGILDGTLDYSS